MVENRKNGKEPVFIIRPAVKRFGLDYLHISLLVLVVILVALAFSLSVFRRGVVLQNCQYGVVNGTCAALEHNGTQALQSAERILASYATVNTSFSLLPYYSLINQSQAAYLPNQDRWLVVIPYLNPLLNNEKSNFSMLLYGSNLTLASPFIETIKPASPTNNTVQGLGFVNIYGRALCTTSKPIQVYLVTDPYAPGAIQSLYTALNASRQFNGSVNMSYYFIFSQYAAGFYNGYGIQKTQALGQYLSCASRQPGKLAGFLSNLTILYKGLPVSNYTLDQVEIGSGMNTTRFNACLNTSAANLNYQASLAGLYGVTVTPEFITDCKYASIPQTLGYAINYTLKSIGSK